MRPTRAHTYSFVLVAGSFLAACEAYDRDVYNAALDATLETSVADGFDAAPDTEPLDVPTPIDSPMTDVPVTDADDAIRPPTDAQPASTCATAHPTAMFCDGFETDGLGGWSGYAIGGGTAMRTTTMAYRGVGALRADTTTAGGTAAIHWNGLAGLATGDVYVRAFYYFPSGYAFDQVSSMLLLPRSAGDNVAVLIGGGGSLGGWSGAGTQYVSAAASAMVPRDRWVCLEMHVTLSATMTGGLEIFLDGTQVASASGFATTPIDGQQEVHVGFPHTSAMQVPATVYVDEVVVDRTRIGCL